MCGICGQISYNRKSIDEKLVGRMCRSLEYRGPDDEGIYINSDSDAMSSGINIGLGHKRLSIIDLSSAARQPMSNEDNTLWITYNGEISLLSKII
ncbi:Asparagine synthetase [glutamine-hydrolyzing] (EC [Olavius sp. associated proteobacterium Delta 1]|nr:Asparagine synthetase [glutamine-hydrolyzing] (EC [Olavius sp. associated proteobacterium Delta 1]